MMKAMLVCVLSTTVAQVFEISEISPISSDGLNEIMNMANQLMMGMEAATRSATNPCEEDMVRLGCDCARCLTSKAALLSPACARLVMAPVPSPMPQPMKDPLTFLGGFAEHVEMGDQNNFEISIEVIEGDGVDEMSNPAFELMRALAPEFLNVMMPEPRPTAPQVVASSHPCAAEVGQCVRDTGSTTRSVIESCLSSHYADLSPTCKCFMHQMESSDSSSAIKQLEPPAAAVPAFRTVHTRGVVSAPEYVELSVEPMQHVSCMLFMPLMVVAIALLVRRCCCAPKPVFAAVVPPEQAFNTVQPLLCVPIAPPLKGEKELTKPTTKA